MGGITGELFRTAKGFIVLFAVICLIVGPAAASGLGKTIMTALGQGTGIVVSAVPQFVNGVKTTGPSQLGGGADAGQGEKN